jgi:hypothetical protein
MLTYWCYLGSATTLSTSTISTSTSVTYRVTPNYSQLASTRTVANPTLPSAGGGTLCASWNVAQTQVSFPINPGAYNLQKVALSNNPDSVYEIECYQSSASGSASQNIGVVPSLDHCIDRCTLAGPSTCQVAYYRKDIGTCEFYSAQVARTPNPMVYNVQTARLITATFPQVIDGAYLLPANTATNLGLCAGPTLSNYDRGFIIVYNQTNTLRSGPGNRQDTYRVDCRGQTFYTSGIASTRQDHIAIATRFGLTPQNADDCARLCNWQNVFASDSTTTGCRFWHWLNSGVCEMYADRPGLVQTTTYNSSVFAAGYSRSSTGSEYLATSVNAYKRSLHPDGDDKHSRRGKRGKKVRNFLPVPVVDETPDALTPHVVIPFHGRH